MLRIVAQISHNPLTTNNTITGRKNVRAGMR